MYNQTATWLLDNTPSIDSNCYLTQSCCKLVVFFLPRCYNFSFHNPNSTNSPSFLTFSLILLLPTRPFDSRFPLLFLSLNFLPLKPDSPTFIFFLISSFFLLSFYFLHSFLFHTKISCNISFFFSHNFRYFYLSIFYAFFLCSLIAFLSFFISFLFALFSFFSILLCFITLKIHFDMIPFIHSFILLFLSNITFLSLFLFLYISFFFLSFFLSFYF
ncbi:unnamed protein product [Acanthosepion pharaonis]|uniref:Uncharacterized protein n=1 Tax=Acanthosepion pharaonis TaxID=158019 RepID=A0A812AXJ6_ACAPH|nr:unnamed protein product [Sepia pharaonis]